MQPAIQESSNDSSDESSSDDGSSKKPFARSNKPLANGSDSDESSSDEESAKKSTALSKKPVAAVRNGSNQKPTTQQKKPSVSSVQKKTQEFDSSDSDSADESEENLHTKAPVVAKKKEESCDSSDSERDSESKDEDKNAKNAKTVQPAKAAAPKRKEEFSKGSESDSDSGELMIVYGVGNTCILGSSDEIYDDDGESSEETSDDKSDKPAKSPQKKKTFVNTATKSVQDEPKTPSKNQSQATGSKTIFVGNLSCTLEVKQVKQFFEKTGEVVDVRLYTFEDGSFKGYAHVEFATAEAARKALEFHQHDLMGRPIWVDRAHTPGSGKEDSIWR